MLSKEASSTIFWVFGMTRPGIERRSPGPLANTLTIESPSTMVGQLFSLNPSLSFLTRQQVLQTIFSSCWSANTGTSMCWVLGIIEERHLYVRPCFSSCVPHVLFVLWVGFWELMVLFIPNKLVHNEYNQIISGFILNISWCY